jgi:hypothetical protein
MSPKMMDVLKACLDPEPARRKTAMELLAMPYFDDIHDLVHDTVLQREYDIAYADAASQGAPSALSLWTATSTYTAKRVAGHNPSLRPSMASGEFQLEDVEAALLGKSQGPQMQGQRHRRNNSTSHAVPTAPALGGAFATAPSTQHAEINKHLKPDAPQMEVAANGRPLSSLRRSKTIGHEDRALAVHALPVSDHPPDITDPERNQRSSEKSSGSHCKVPDAAQDGCHGLNAEHQAASASAESVHSAQQGGQNATLIASTSSRAIRMSESNKDDPSNASAKVGSKGVTFIYIRG